MDGMERFTSDTLALVPEDYHAMASKLANLEAENVMLRRGVHERGQKITDLLSTIDAMHNAAPGVAAPSPNGVIDFPIPTEASGG